jgi:hypothetical protein
MWGSSSSRSGQLSNFLYQYITNKAAFQLQSQQHMGKKQEKIVNNCRLKLISSQKCDMIKSIFYTILPIITAGIIGNK